MNWCIFDNNSVCMNNKSPELFGKRCIEANNLLLSEQTFCRFHVDVNKLDDQTLNDICLYLYDGKCAHDLCKACGESCLRNSGELCSFFMSRDTFKNQKEKEMPQTNCSYAKVENETTICTNPDNDDDYGERCAEVYCLYPEGYICPHNTNEVENTIDNVNHPNHYCQGGIECIKAIEASMTPEEFQGYCKGNVMKYIWRFREKNGLEDLKKAQDQAEKEKKKIK